MSGRGRPDAAGIPLAVLLTAANPHDSTLFAALLDELPAVRTPAGRRRSTPRKVHADKAYDYRGCRAELRQRGIKVRIARRGIESSARLGRSRWKVERTIAWLLGFRRLRIRYEVCDERFYAFALLACSLVCFHALTSHLGEIGCMAGVRYGGRMEDSPSALAGCWREGCGRR